MTDQDLTELKGLMEKATPAPWTNGRDEYDGFVSTDSQDGPTIFRPGVMNANSSADAECVAALRNHAPALIRAKERENALAAVCRSVIRLYNTRCLDPVDCDKIIDGKRMPRCDNCLLRYEAQLALVTGLPGLKSDAQSETRGGG